MADELNAVLAERIDYGSALAIFRVIPKGWDIPNFKPGQYSTLGVYASTARAVGCEPDKTPIADPTKLLKRAYSIASAPSEKNYVEFNIALVRQGLFTPRLWSLKVGDSLFMGPKITGTFIMDSVPEDKNVVFVGTGTGLGPFMSMISDSFKAGSNRHFAVFHGVRTSQELAYRGELINLARFHPNFHYFPIISRPHEDKAPWKGITGHVQKLWESKVLDQAFPGGATPENTHFFLCGSPNMIKDLTALLGASGFTEHTHKTPGQVHIEKYW